MGNILCERHNNALRCLDAVALKFFKTVIRILQEINDKKTADVERVFLFNGHDIERWLLKTLCGSVFSGNTMDQNREKIKWKPSVTWVNMIYGTQHFAPRYGMYLYAETGGKAYAEREVSFSPISDKEGEIRGASITIMGIITFKLLMITPPPNIRFNHTYYRPPEIIFKIKDVTKVIAFAWDVPVEQRALSITLSKLEFQKGK